MCISSRKNLAWDVGGKMILNPNIAERVASKLVCWGKALTFVLTVQPSPAP